MFVGHYSAAIAAKAIAPKAPFWALVAGCQLVDIGWASFIMAGIEQADVDPSLPGSVLVLHHMPWTHSLPAAVVWSVAAMVLAKLALRLSWGVGAVIGAVVFSHWILDFIVHRPDLALWPGGPEVGLGLWNLPVPEQAVEIGLIALAGVFWGASRARAGLSAWPPAVFVLLLLAVQISAMFIPMEDVPMQMGGSALATYLLITLAAVFADRRPKTA